MITFTPEEITVCLTVYINGELNEHYTESVADKILATVGADRYAAMLQILKEVMANTSEIRQGFCSRLASASIEAYQEGLVSMSVRHAIKESSNNVVPIRAAVFHHPV